MRRSLAILFAAVFFTWPALYNRYPLLYPDSISYMNAGRGLARALFLHGARGFEGMRSELYSLVILPVHLGRSPWGIVFLQGLITAWMLWLVVRAFAGHKVLLRYLSLTTALSLLTTVSWYVSLIMPDILGATLYLGIFLLVFARDTMSRVERYGVFALAVWAATAHTTHLVLGMFVVCVLAVGYALRRPLLAGRGREILQAAGVVVVAAALQMALHGYLYGKASLSGKHPPYLMARIIADGPGAEYLRTHCVLLRWTICKHADNLPDNDDNFLWGEDGIWPTATPAEQEALLREEGPLVSVTLRTYPREELGVAGRNFWDQLTDFGVDDFDNNTWMEASMETGMPGSRARYDRSLQARSEVPSHLFTVLQRWVVIAALVGVAVMLPWVWRRKQEWLLGLALVVLPVLVVNAALTGVLSEVDSRYQARVIWLLPMLAMLMFFHWREPDAEA
jgi:hypothetical protein